MPAVDVDFSLPVAGLLVGTVVGLTGMGGGALLTPLLVLFFRVEPLAAISSDLLTSLVMKPVGAAVHLRHRTVNWRLVGLLTVGSVPSAFAGAVFISSVAHRAGVQDDLKVIIGVALCTSVAMMVVRQLLDRRVRRRDTEARMPASTGSGGAGQPLVIHPVRTLAIGVIGGFLVGMTSVGAGSLIIALLLISYPTLQPAQLVGTDIVQAIPLVAAATAGHLLFGDVHFSLASFLLLGALPGVYFGARLSAQGPSAVIRPLIAAVLLASALALLRASAPVVIAGAIAGLVAMVVLAPVRVFSFE